VVSRPVRVRNALGALWAAWAVSAAALFVNQFVFHGTGIGPGLSVGGISLLVQAIALVTIGRGSSLGRGVAVAFLVLSTISLSIVGRLIADRSFVAAGYTVLGFVLKAVGVYLLFTRTSKSWFAANS
jgi:hypothetical protein